MSTVSEILATKGGHLQSVGPQATVFDAASLMNEQKIGCLVVMEGGRLVGMFSERDILKRVVGERRDPASARVAEVMTTEVICCRPDTEVDEARSIMKHRRIRHLPVVDEDDGLCGLVSIGDLNAYEIRDHQSTISVLEQYIYGRT